MSSLGRASSNSKNTKANKLKRMDASHKAFLIEDELVRRINQLSILIPDLVVQGKTDEHMIATHRRNELEDLKDWIQGEIFGSNTLGTRCPLKIWDILKYGEHGEIYRATNTVDTWNGCEVQLTQTHDRDTNLILIIAKSPKVQNHSVNVGNIVKLVGAVTRADWIYVGKREIVKRSNRDALFSMVIEMARVLDYLLDNNIYMGRNPDSAIRLGLVKVMEDAVDAIEKYPGGFVKNVELALEDSCPGEEKFEIYKDELQRVKQEILYLDDDQLAEKIEEIISLTYYFYQNWWGILEWDRRIDVSITEEDMLKIATLKLQIGSTNR